MAFGHVAASLFVGYVAANNCTFCTDMFMYDLSTLPKATFVLHKVQAHSSRHRHAAGNAMADALAVTATADPADAAAQGRQAAAQVTELCCMALRLPSFACTCPS